MADAVYRRTGYPVDDALVTGDVVYQSINEALAFIAAETDWPWLRAQEPLTTVVGTATYAVPSDWIRTDRIVDDDGDPLERVDARQLEDEWGDQRGRPVAWATDVDASGNEVIVLRPIPDAARTFKHFYVRREKVLSSDTEAPYLPSQFHDAVVALAEALVLEVGRDDERAARARARYEQWRSRMLDDRRRSRGPMRIRIREGSAF